MNNRRALGDRLTYVVVAGINLCVGLMFATILIPSPGPSDVQAITIATQNVREPQPAPTPDAPKPISGIPTRVVVPSVEIDMSVRTGSYDEHSQTWTVDSLSAFYADRTVPVNDTNGTTLIYGHAEWGVFGRLPDIAEGAEAQVYTENGKQFSYVYESSRQVEPNDVSALTVNGPPKLILQTCSGMFDAFRTLVTFRLKEVIANE